MNKDYNYYMLEIIFITVENKYILSIFIGAMFILIITSKLYMNN